MRNLDRELQALHDKHVAPLKQAAQRLFSSEDGKKLLFALERAFTDDLTPKDKNGAIDASAVLVRVGARQVIDYLRTLAEFKEGQGT